MNIIDKKFNNLLIELNKLSEEEIYNHIKEEYKKINPITKNNVENFFNHFNYWGSLNEKSENFEEIKLKAQTLKENIKNYKELYQNLEDYRSKLTLYSILNNWYNYDFQNLSNVQEKMFDDYFDLDLLKPSEDEVIIDLGAYNGDTVLSYVKCYGKKYKKIYCFDITKETINTLKENTKHLPNINIINKGVGSKKEEKFVSENCESPSANTLTNQGINEVIVTTLDEEIKEKITIIKTDIEGEDFNALKGAYNHIKNDHPKLLISVYHHNDDIWQIPKYIKSIHKDYKFYLRYHGGSIYPTEITLIAI